MQRYFIPPSQWGVDQVQVTGDDAFHAHTVMRLAKGERFAVADNSGRVAICEVVSLTKQELTGTILETTVETEEIPQVVVGQALIRKDGFETVLQKATELGAQAILPLSFRRGIVRFDKDDEKKKRPRYEAIVKEASEQSERAFVPEILPVADVFAIDPSSYGTILVAHAREHEDRHLATFAESIDWQKPILVVIGPEGGIEDGELAHLEQIGGIRVSLGKRILRSETASAYLLSSLFTLYEVRR
jgi:16S rRNA (uracil1498-N3)-methyltransferase